VCEVSGDDGDKQWNCGRGWKEHTQMVPLQTQPKIICKRGEEYIEAKDVALASATLHCTAGPVSIANGEYRS
jgi:hypothetical protein